MAFDTKAMLKTCSSACCCIMCVQTCACEGCFLFRHYHSEEFIMGTELYKYCTIEVLRLTRTEKKQLLMDKFRSFKVDVTPTNSYKFVILIGEGRSMHIVCRRGFCRAYGVSIWYLDDIIGRLKNKDTVCLTNANPVAAITASSMPTDRLHRFVADFGISLTPQQIGATRLPQTEISMMCSSWMSYYFSLVGDQVPNSDGEIHLEPIPKKEVYKEYRIDMQLRNHECLALNWFVKLWKKVFPYVKVRKYKSSCGHCNLCTLLGEARRKFRDKTGRQEVTNLFAIHRMSTMGERRTYYDRRMEASMNSHLFLSTIADGMQQNHCTLPWFGNTKNPNCHIKQHLQGVLMHGHNMTVYRTFANVGGGANLAVHTWLLSLESYSRLHNGRLPSILYHQIDGGSENCNAAFLGVCNLLVACGLVDKVVLTRLPVGHTHEDIDGLFALIWRKLRDEFILTPSEFVKLIQISLRKKVVVTVVDLMVIPNYNKIMGGCVDPDLARWAKEEWAQLQITFKKVEKSDKHPLGVETTYRPYVQDEFVEIVEDSGPPTEHSSVCGLIPQLCEARTHPLPGEPSLNWLHKIPSSDFEPDAFIEDSLDVMKKVAEKMSTAYANDKPNVSSEWDTWITDSVPESEDANDYRSESGGVLPQTTGTGSLLYVSEDGSVYVPFKNSVFGHTGVENVQVNARSGRPRLSVVGGMNMRVVKSNSCVIHSGNKSAAAKRVPSRTVLLDVDGTTPATPYGVLPTYYPGREARKTLQQRRAAEKKRKKLDDAEREQQQNSDDADLANDSDSSSELKKKKRKKKAPAKKKQSAAKERGKKKKSAVIDSSDTSEDSDSSIESKLVPSNDEDEDIEPGADDTINTEVFIVDDKIVNCRSLAGVVKKVYTDNADGLFYDVHYNDGRVDLKLAGKYVYRKPPRSNNCRTRSSQSHYVNEIITDPHYVNDGDIDSSNVLQGNRRNTSARRDA